MKRLIVITLLHLLTFSEASSQSITDTLVIGYTSAAPFIILQEGEPPKGLSIWLWRKVAEDLQIPYKLQLMSFNEMLVAIAEGQIDASINPLTITSERNKNGFSGEV